MEAQKSGVVAKPRNPKWAAVRMRLAEEGHEALDGQPSGRSPSTRASWTHVLHKALDTIHGVEKPEVLHLESGGVHYKCWAQSEEDMLSVLRKLWALQAKHREQQDDIRTRKGDGERTSAGGQLKAVGFLRKLRRAK